MLDPLYLRLRRSRHPSWAKSEKQRKGQITAMRDDLPRIAAHTATGGPKKAKDFVISTGLELRKRIPLARFAPLLRRAAAQKSRSAKIVLDGAGRAGARSEERRVGKERRCRWPAAH